MPAQPGRGAAPKARGDLLQSLGGNFSYNFHNRRRLFQHLPIIKPEHPQSLGFQSARPLLIPRSIGKLKMLTAIHFDNQAGRGAIEVDDVIQDRPLPIEANAADLSSSQMPPKALFRIRLVLP